MHHFFSAEMGFYKLYHFTDESLPIAQDYGPDQDSRPTGSTLRRFLRTRFNEPFLRDGDNLWFFFAGHGVRYEGRDYLMPIDADPEDLDNSAIPIQYISQRLRRSGADNIILLIDACRSYEGRRDGIGIGKEKQQGVITLFSCSPEESSYEIQELQQGAFTHTLLDSLRLQGEGNCATVERLYQRLRYYVPQLTRQYKQTVQTPYGVIEPLSKNHLILLPGQATLSDVGAIKKDALTAEVQGRTKKARRLWIRVLAVSPADPEAIEGIERLLGGSPQPTAVAETLPIKRGADPVSPSPDLSLNVPLDSSSVSRSFRKSEPSLSQKRGSEPIASPVHSPSPEKSQPKQNRGSAHQLSTFSDRGIETGPLQVWKVLLGISGSFIVLLTAVIVSFRQGPPNRPTPSTSQSSENSSETLPSNQDESSLLQPSAPSTKISSPITPCATISNLNSEFDSASLSLLSPLNLPKGTLVRFDSNSSEQLSSNKNRNVLMAQAAPSFPFPDSVPQGTEVVISSTTHNTTCISNALEQAFESNFSGTQVEVEERDDPIQDVLNGNADLAAISRPLTAEEKAKGLIEVSVAREKIAVIVGANNSFSQSITGSQFAQIFRGEIKDWSEIGGEAGPIKVVDRPADSDVRASLQPYPVFTTAPFQPASGHITVSADDTEAVVDVLGRDGIGYAPLGQVLNNDSVKSLQLHKTPPTDPRYAFSQPYSYVYAGGASPAVSAFLGLATSQEGQAVVSEAISAP